MGAMRVASNCTTLVYDGAMATSKQVRRSVTLPARLAEQVERIARKKRLSDNRVLVELVEQGLEAQKEKEKAFFSPWRSAFERPQTRKR